MRELVWMDAEVWMVLTGWTFRFVWRGHHGQPGAHVNKMLLVAMHSIHTGSKPTKNHKKEKKTRNVWMARDVRIAREGEVWI